MRDFLELLLLIYITMSFFYIAITISYLCDDYIENIDMAQILISIFYLLATIIGSLLYFIFHYLIYEKLYLKTNLFFIANFQPIKYIKKKLRRINS